MHAALDDPTVSYILETRQPFEDLQQVASQLAGLLVLAASGASSASPDHPMLAAAREAWARAADAIQLARPDARSRDHHRHLLDAVTAIDAALSSAAGALRGDRRDAVDAILIPLKAGYAHLQEAGARLPGFELVGFSQGCCATRHMGQVGQVRRVGQHGGRR